jgi:hypothetical protein
MGLVALRPGKRKRRKARGVNILSGVCPVVHEKELNVLGVLDEECLVAGGHHVAGLLVATVTDLYPETIIYQHLSRRAVVDGVWCRRKYVGVPNPYLGHSSLSTEASADTVVDTLRLAP